MTFLTHGVVPISEYDIAAGGSVVSDPLMNSSGWEARSSSACGTHRIMTKPTLAANETWTYRIGPNVVEFPI